MKAVRRRQGTRFLDDVPALLAVIQEARLLFGVQAARSLWHVVGLPASAEMVEGGKGVGATDTLSTSEAQLALAAFLDEACEQNHGARAQAAVLHQAYTAWALRTGAPTLSLTAFGRLMRRLGRAKVCASRVYYLGLSLRGDLSSPKPTPSPCPLFDESGAEPGDGLPTADQDGRRV